MKMITLKPLGFNEAVDAVSNPRLSASDVIDRLHEDPDHAITTEEWASIVSFCAYRARRHYHQRQKKGFRYKAGGVQRTSSNPLLATVSDPLAYDRYMGRVVLFLRFAKENQHKTGAWVLFVYRCRFATFEAVLDANVHGVGGLFDGMTTVTEYLKSYPLKKIVECQTILRKTNRKPTDIEGLTYELRKTTKKPATVERMVSIYQGFAKVRYVDELPEDNPKDHDH
jgi:hypothetical protein